MVIINKFASSLTIGKYATLDSLIYDNVDFIKMDIEGNEWDALYGAKRIITESHAIKCAICSYHRGFDEILIKDILDKYGLKCSTSLGYMWFSGLENDYTNTRSRLSKALVRGIK